MAVYIHACNNCAYCTYCSTYESDNEEEFQYARFLPEQLVREFQGDNANSIISDCKQAVDEFYKNIANDSIPADALEKFNTLYAIGCYVKRYIASLINTHPAKNEFDINDFVRTKSVETILYYYSVTGIDEPLVLCLFFANRFDVLDKLNEIAYFKANPSAYPILSYFSNRSIPISNEMLVYVAKQSSAKAVIETCFNICATNFTNLLVEQKPAITCTGIGMVELPEKLELLNCGENTHSGDFSRGIPKNLDYLICQPSWDTKTVTSWDITKIINRGSFQLLQNALQQLIPEVDARKASVLEYSAKADLLKSLNHFRPDLHSHLIGELQRIVA